MKRKNQNGAALIEAALSITVLFSIVLGTLSLSSSIREQQKITEALHRAAIKISRITSVDSQSSAPDRGDMRCAVFQTLVQDELRKESITQSNISIVSPQSGSRGAPLTTKQEIVVKLESKPFFGTPTARVHISTPQYESPVDCSGNGRIVFEQ